MQLLDDVAQRQGQGICIHFFFDDVASLVEDGAAGLDHVKTGLASSTHVQPGSQHGGLCAMALWDAVVWIAIVGVVVGDPVATVELMLLQFSVSDGGGDTPDSEGARVARAAKFLGTMSVCPTHLGMWQDKGRIHVGE